MTEADTHGVHKLSLKGVCSLPWRYGERSGHSGGAKSSCTPAITLGIWLRRPPPPESVLGEVFRAGPIGRRPQGNSRACWEQ